MLPDRELRELLDSITDTEILLFKGILYGEFGTRKTTTALRCMKNKAVLLHADRGWQVYKNHPDEFTDDNVIAVEYQGLSQVKAIVEAIAGQQEPFNGTDLIVCDTISQMQENYIDFILENTDYGGKFRDRPTIKTASRNTVKMSDIPDVPAMVDYHLARNKMRPVIELLIKAPVNVLFLGHTREPGPIEKADGKLEKRINVTEALYKVIARDATFIGLTRREKGKFTVDFEPKNTQSAKSQIPELTDKKIDSSELPDVLKKWSSN
jgi:hypothetical protein